MPDALRAAPPGTPGAEAAPAQSAAPPTGHGGWPGAMPRHSRHRPDDLPAMDESDATAWAMPYTDLTMLLMVFFIVKLSLMGPSPPGMPDTPVPDAPVAQTTPDTAQTRVELPPSGGAHDGSPLDAGTGLLPAGQALLGDPAPGQRRDATGSGSISGDRAGPTEGRQSAPPADPWINDRPAAPPGQPRATPDATADFDAEWARRVRALESSAADFLQRTGLNGQIDLVATDVGIELRLPDEVLFPSGSADIQAAGARLLMRVARLLQTLDGEIQISGHTDNIPIRTARFPSNWELSAARAIALVRLLRDLGIAEERMQAVGHGDNRPIASNATTAGRATNRRVTIDVTPPVAPR